MAFTKRELNLLIISMAVIFILLGDKYIISPVIVSRNATSEQAAQTAAEKEENLIIIKNTGPTALRKWKKMQDNGLPEETKAESQIINYINTLSARHQIQLSSIQPDHGEKKDGIGVIEFIIAGSAQAIKCYEFIWNIETTDIPLKIQSVHLSSKDTTSGQVSVQLKISSIYSYQVEEKEEN